MTWHSFPLTSKNSEQSDTTVIFLNLALAISLIDNELWVTSVFIAFINGLVYNFETTGVALNFPNSSHGITCIFAFIELAGSFFAFIQIPITEQVKERGSLLWTITFKIYVRSNPLQRLQKLGPFWIFWTRDLAVVTSNGTGDFHDRQINWRDNQYAYWVKLCISSYYFSRSYLYIE